MFTRNDSQPHSATTSLEATIASARAGFVCLFSSSEEFEDALISERRAQGRYNRPSWVPIGMFIGTSLIVAGVALLLA
jgi:hypothetical protein